MIVPRLQRTAPLPIATQAAPAVAILATHLRVRRFCRMRRRHGLFGASSDARAIRPAYGRHLVDDLSKPTYAYCEFT